MEHIALAEKLRIAPETVAALSVLRVEPETESRLKTLFLTRQDLFDKAVEQYENAPLLVLWLYLKWALATMDLYRKRGIPETVIYDCLQDLRIWSNAYKAETGLSGISQWEWNGFSVRGEVIRLGRLQFQPRVLIKELAVSNRVFPAGTPVLEVHIPAEEPLSPDSVTDSLRRAPAFFKTHFNQIFSLYHCHSWLISPELPNFLPEQSRILQFMRRFTVYDVSADRQAEERVFGCISDDFSEYPENTSLQGRLKQYILSGKTVGMGFGVILIDMDCYK